MLPCNVIVIEQAEKKIEISAVDTVASMQAVDNKSLSDIALEIQSKLKKVISSLN